jgi:hypothetical protein
MSVSQDATSGWFLPESTAEWVVLLDGSGLSGPASAWLCDESTGNLADAIGGDTATLTNTFGTLAYQQAITGWDRDAVTVSDGSIISFNSSGVSLNLGTTSAMMLAFVERTGTPADTRIIMGMGGALYANILSAWLDASNHLRIGTGTSPTAAGTVDHGLNTLVPIILQHDVTNRVQRIITPSETITMSFTAFASEAGRCFLGSLGGVGGPPMGVAYWALWTGASAEMTAPEITELFSRLEDGVPTSVTTLGAMQAGSMGMGWIALIEGCKYALSDKPAAAVQAALVGTDWEAAEVISGLFVQMRNQQSIDPDTSFAGSSSCQLRVVDTDGNDTFGTFVARRLSGAETEITATVDRDDTTINVASTTGFTNSGEIYIGTECVGYSGKTGTTFTGLTRGKFSPVGCAPSGNGGDRFPNHHRYGVDARYIQRQPVVTQLPRVWLGKRVSIHLHTWDGSNLNSLANSQRVYAGRLVGISDDPDTFHTVLDIEHYSGEWKNGVIGKDMYQGQIAEGIWIATGRRFKFNEGIDGAVTSATDLVTVASGASGAFQMDEGFYSLSELTQKWNAWLGAAVVAAEIDGSYSWSSPVNHRGDGLRTICQWHVPNASNVRVNFKLEAPTEIMAFLGLVDIEPTQNGQMAAFAGGPNRDANEDHTTAGAAVPYTTVVFRPTAAGRIAQEFGESLNYDIENERGTFTDQRAMMPAAVREFCPAGEDYGFFLVDDRAILVGSYDGAGRLTNCFLAPYQATTDGEQDALSYIGRRADEPQAPVTIRQIFILEGTLNTIVNTLAYSTGVSGWNHASHDALGNGLGLGMPGGLLGSEFENSVLNLPGSDAPLVVVIDEPTKLSEILDSDFKIRRAFVRFKNGGFDVRQWVTPTTGAAVSTLEEANKAAPSGADENHRTALQETDEYLVTSTKLDYSRDFAVGRDGKYLKSISIEDQAGADASGNGGTGRRSETLRMRNTFASFASTGSAVESLVPGYIAATPLFSSAARRLARTIDLRYFEGLAVGDVVVVEDSFARDPVTGQRGVVSRPAVVVRTSYDLGGPTANGTVRQMVGELECLFLDVHRGEAFSPSADVDETYASGGYSAGYLAAGPTLRCKQHVYSHTFSLTGRNGVVVSIAENNDAANFEEDDEIDIIERDPADSANPLRWTRTVVSRSGDDLTINTALSAPAFDSTKRYRITSAAYTSAQSTQQDDCYQADNDDLLIQDEDPPFHYSVTDEEWAFNVNSRTEKAELVPTISYGDGRPEDVGHSRAICNALDQYIDRKSAKNCGLMMAGTDRALAGLSGIGNTVWATLFVYPVFFGTEGLGTAISRPLTVSPFFRSATGGVDAWIRVTITDQLPTMFPAVAEGAPTAGAYGDPMMPGRFSQSTTWTTTSNTWQTGADYELNLVKGTHFGVAYIIVEGAGAADCRGLSVCHEEPREVVS